MTEEELEKLREIRGQALGIAVRSGLEYTLYREGRNGLKKLESELGKLGFPINYKDIRPLDFYPLAWEGVVFAVARDLFGYSNEDFQELGEREAKLPLIIRLFVKYLGSISMIAREGPKLWRKYYSVGDLKITDFDDAKKYAVVRIGDFEVSPLHCQNIIGYLRGVVEMVGKEGVTCEERKCVHRGDGYHEFLLKWK